MTRIEDHSLGEYSLGSSNPKITDEETLPTPLASCAFYSVCSSIRKNEIGCQRDIHTVIQFFCDGPAQNYIKKGNQRT